MKKIHGRVLHFMFIIFMSLNSFSQSDKNALPVSVFNGTDSTKPVLFYITGDGGWNKFSNSFVQNLNRQGYEVVGLNARAYFWHKKDAAQTANDMSAVISNQLKMRKNKSFILIGYSFGADVMPFVITHGDAGLMDGLRHTILLSPSAKTDFEVHISELLGAGTSNGENVPEEINKLSKPVLLIFGDEETDFPVKDIHTKNFNIVKLPGGHHYDGDAAAVCTVILPYIK